LQEESVRSTRSALALTLVGALALAACGGDEETEATVAAVSPTVNVGRTSDPLSQLIAEIYGQGMENAGVRVGRKDPVADLDALHAALDAGNVQFIPETTVSLLDRLGVDVPATTDEQLAAINEALPAEQSVTVVGSATATKVVACSVAAVEANSLKTISDLAGVAADITLGGTTGFESSASFDLADLNTAYEADFTFAASGDTDAEVAAAVVAGDADCGVLSSLEPMITTEGLLSLEDDKAAAPVDAFVPLLQATAATPEVVAVITQLNSLVTTDVLRALLVKLETGDQTPDVLAKAFLASQSSDG
jgi:osmoprotectant transport system substrate-binding protein